MTKYFWSKVNFLAAHKLDRFCPNGFNQRDICSLSITKIPFNWFSQYEDISNSMYIYILLLFTLSNNYILYQNYFYLSKFDVVFFWNYFFAFITCWRWCPVAYLLYALFNYGDKRKGYASLLADKLEHSPENVNHDSYGAVNSSVILCSICCYCPLKKVSVYILRVLQIQIQIQVTDT